MYVYDYVENYKEWDQFVITNKFLPIAILIEWLKPAYFYIDI